MISLKKLLEQHLGGAMGSRTNTITIDGMPAAEVHWMIVDLIKKDPARAKKVIVSLSKKLKPGQDLSLLQTYLDSYTRNTSIDSRIGTHMINAKNKALTQAFINSMTM